jgi:hypothetical protein
MVMKLHAFHQPSDLLLKIGAAPLITAKAIGMKAKSIIVNTSGKAAEKPVTLGKS